METYLIFAISLLTGSWLPTQGQTTESITGEAYTTGNPWIPTEGQDFTTAKPWWPTEGPVDMTTEGSGSPVDGRTIEIHYHHEYLEKEIRIAGQRETIANLPIFTDGQNLYIPTADIGVSQEFDSYTMTIVSQLGDYCKIKLMFNWDYPDFDLLRPYYSDLMLANGWMSSGYSVDLPDAYEKWTRN